MSNFAYDKLLSVYTDNPMVKIPLERDVQNTLASVLDAHFKQLPDAEMDDMVDENYRLMAVKLRLEAVFAFRQELEKDKQEKYYASYRKRNGFDDWIEVYKTELAALNIFLARYFTHDIKDADPAYKQEVWILLELVRYIHAKSRQLYCFENNPYTFSGDIDREIAEVNKQAHIFGRGSSFILALFALIFLTNLAVAVRFHSFGQLFWGIALLSLLLLAAGYKGLKALIGSNQHKEVLNGWKADILVKEKMEGIIARTRKQQ